MDTMAVHVPFDLLHDESLTYADKRLWAAMRLDQKYKTAADVHQTAWWADRANLSLATVYNSMKRLVAAGWCKYCNGRPKAIVNRPLKADWWVEMSEELVVCKQLKARDVILYALLMWENHRSFKGRFTYKALGECARACIKTVRRAIQSLKLADWLNTSQKNQMASIAFRFDSPSKKYCREQIALTEMRLNRPGGHGEAIAEAMVTFVVAPSDYIPNARPSWLRNPATREFMEVDLLIPDLKLAVEFQGAQHFRPTDFASEEEVARQKQRDAIKMQLLRNKGYTVVVLTAADLSVQAVAAKLKGLVPLRDLRWYGPLAAYLDKVGLRYQQKALRMEAQGV